MKIKEEIKASREKEEFYFILENLVRTKRTRVIIERYRNKKLYKVKSYKVNSELFLNDVF